MKQKEPPVDALRSMNMARIQQKNTRPEIFVRRLLHSLGFRFRLHGKDLPGSPDIVFRSRKKVVFVHGCFWHRHQGCTKSATPKTRTDFWNTKFQANEARDATVQNMLLKMGWEYLIVWECELNEPKLLSQKLCKFLS